MGAEAPHSPIANGLIKTGSRSLPGPHLPLNKFVLEPEEVASLQKRYGCSVDELMQLLVAPASLLARAPTSDFPVGCVRRPQDLNNFRYASLQTAASWGRIYVLQNQISAAEDKVYMGDWVLHAVSCDRQCAGPSAWASQAICMLG